MPPQTKKKARRGIDSPADLNIAGEFETLPAAAIVIGRAHIGQPFRRTNQAISMNSPLLLDATEAGRLLGVCASTFNKWHANEQLPVPVAVDAGRQLWSRVQIEEWAANLRPLEDQDQK